jgi:hypothetical protein
MRHQVRETLINYCSIPMVYIANEQSACQHNIWNVKLYIKWYISHQSIVGYTLIKRAKHMSMECATKALINSITHACTYPYIWMYRLTQSLLIRVGHYFMHGGSCCVRIDLFLLKHVCYLKYDAMHILIIQLGAT